VPGGVDQVGGNYYLPGTERLPSALAAPWPTCRFTNFNPYTVTDAQLTVNGLPCILNYAPRDIRGEG
jgi:hypothetical protein